MTHPLTDEVIEQITYETRCTPDPGDLVFNSDDMRAAADWQLEQVIEWAYKHLTPFEILDLRKAMRPQEE